MTTRKCANCPAREAAAMLARSAIRAGTRFSRCPGGGKMAVYRKDLFRDQNQTIKLTLFTLQRRPDALRGVFQPLNRHEFTLDALNRPIWVLSNRTILTLSCRHPTYGKNFLCAFTRVKRYLTCVNFPFLSSPQVSRSHPRALGRRAEQAFAIPVRVQASMRCGNSGHISEDRRTCRIPE